jgi:hypothetical protein
MKEEGTEFICYLEFKVPEFLFRVEGFTASLLKKAVKLYFEGSNCQFYSMQ